MIPPTCNSNLADTVSSATAAELREIRAIAISTASAYLTCNKEQLAILSDPERLGSGCVNDRDPFFTQTVNACSVLGNTRLSFVPLVASVSSSQVIGHITVLAALRKRLDQWKLLTITQDPVSLRLLDGPLQTLASSLVQGASLPSPIPATAKLITPDWTFPAPSGGQRFGSFTWEPSPSPDLAAEVVEFEEALSV
jgi:hypothetical protein